jgi:hypothetical protein
MKTLTPLRRFGFFLAITFIAAACDFNPLFFWPAYREFWVNVYDHYGGGFLAMLAIAGALALGPWSKKEVS